MIILKNVSKDYEIKSGVVHALADINIELPERGMIFILGKSGCGKSTLLNILGGLDTYTSGEMVVDGVSTKDYSGVSWDDYRNNKVGFVFQEYNLIDEYDIKNNLAIAGQLQGKSKKEIDTTIAEALASVGLSGYEKRKTSELSGGQKQRIAIARVLCKDTTLILADEPTGNLDSENSREIIETLQNISKNKLVVVVTHDNETAQEYGDRIIKLSDGKLVKDLLRKKSEKQNAVSVESTSSIKQNGAKIIEEYWSLDKNKRQMTNKQKKKQQISVSSLLVLSMRNLWKKKWRLLVSVVLFFFTLTLFGLGIAAIRYDSGKVIYGAYINSGEKEIRVELKNTSATERQDFFVEDYAELVQKFPNHQFNAMYGVSFSVGEIENYYSFNQCVVVDDGMINSYGYEKNLFGKLPIEDDEFCISKFAADSIISQKIFKNCLNYDDLIKTMTITYIQPEFPLKLVGIVDTQTKEKFDKIEKDFKLKNGNELSVNKQIELSYLIDAEKRFSLSQSLMVAECFMKTTIYRTGSEDVTYTINSFNTINDTVETKTIKDRIMEESLLSSFEKETIVFADKSSGIGNNEVVVSSNMVNQLIASENKGNFVSEDKIMEFINDGLYMKDVKVTKGHWSNVCTGSEKLKVVGYYKSSADTRDLVVVNEDTFVSYKYPINIASYNVTLTGNRKDDMALLEETRKDKYIVTSSIEREIDGAERLVDMFQKLGIVLTIAFGIFSVIMMTNFMVTSIKTNKKQIGILRAIGMRTNGVFFIFFVEAFAVGLISFVAALITIFPMAILASSFAPTNLYFIQIIFIGIVEVVAMFAFSMFICIGGSLIPILKKAKTPPIKLIKD